MPEGGRSRRSSQPFHARLRQLAGPHHWIHAVDCAAPEPDDVWGDWVVEPSVALVLRLDAGSRERRLPRVVTAVVRIAREDATGWAKAVANAAVEAARGITGVAALELGPAGVRANTVVVGHDTPAEDVARTVAYLEHADFTTGATYWLTRSPTDTSVLDGSPIPGRVLVTGAAGGLGAQTARTLAAAGWTVVPSDLPGADLEELAGSLEVTSLPLDVTDARQVRALPRASQLDDGLAGVAVMHGVGTSAALGELDETAVRRAIAINGTGVHDVLRAILPLLEGGAPSAAVVLASQAGLRAEAYHVTYCAAKFAVVGLVRGLAGVLDDRDVRIHVLCPGPVDTPLMRRAFAGLAEGEGISPEEYRTRRIAAIPARRLGTPEDIADAVIHLFGLAATGVIAAPTGGESLT